MKKPGKAYYMISAVAQKYNIHPQTLRLYEREGLLKPSRTDGNTRLYSEEDLEQLETILSLTRDLGVNLAGVEIILNMRRKTELMQREVNEFMEYVKRELARGLDETEVALVNQVEDGHAAAAIPPRVADDEPEIGFDELGHRRLVAIALDAKAQRSLFVDGQQRHLRDLAQVRSQRAGVAVRSRVPLRHLVPLYNRHARVTTEN